MGFQDVTKKAKQLHAIARRFPETGKDATNFWDRIQAIISEHAIDLSDEEKDIAASYVATKPR